MIKARNNPLGADPSNTEHFPEVAQVEETTCRDGFHILNESSGRFALNRLSLRIFAPHCH
jgi:hypothetical protein